ncbi:large conductance mechanosensitive channel protein MscL [Cellulomonas sp. P5_C5]
MTDRLSTGISGARQGLKGTAKVFQGFKDFISRGNAIELAVGVVIGAAFGSVIKAIQDAFISPLIGWIFGAPDLTELWDIGPYTWGDNPDATPISVGAILNALLAFVLTAAAVYFLIVLPLNALAARRKSGEEEEPAAPAEDILLLQEIRDLLANRLTPAIVNDAGAGAAPGTGAGPATGPGTDPGTGPGTGPIAPTTGTDLPPSIPPGPSAPRPS